MASEQPTIGISGDQPTTELQTPISTGGGEFCSNCRAPLASDQRYCMECGQRRVSERSPFGAMTAPAPPPRAAAGAPASSASGGKRRMTVNGTFIAGIGTLLLAMGVGVLIGRTDTGSTAKTSAPQVITVPAGSGGATSTAPTASTPTTTTPSTSSSAGSSSKQTAATAATAGGATARPGAAQSSPVVKVGGACPKNQVGGCQGGHFTGNFFGGGSGG
jgi:hypothetical protein